MEWADEMDLDENPASTTTHASSSALTESGGLRSRLGPGRWAKGTKRSGYGGTKSTRGLPLGWQEEKIAAASQHITITATDKAMGKKKATVGYKNDSDGTSARLLSSELRRSTRVLPNDRITDYRMDEWSETDQESGEIPDSDAESEDNADSHSSSSKDSEDGPELWERQRRIRPRCEIRVLGF